MRKISKLLSLSALCVMLAAPAFAQDAAPTDNTMTPPAPGAMMEKRHEVRKERREHRQDMRKERREHRQDARKERREHRKDTRKERHQEMKGSESEAQ